MLNLKEKFFALIRYAITGEKLPEDFACDKNSIEELFKLSSAHDITSITAYALEKNGLLSDCPTSARMRDELLFSVGRITLLEYFSEEVFDSLDQAEIDYVPLKGAVLRKLYPRDFFRTSSDLDMLVKKEDFDRACAVLKEKLNLKEKYRSSHDLAMNRSEMETVEVHYSLLEEDRAKGCFDILKDAWKYARLVKGHRYEFSEEFFKFYHVAHMLKHFEQAGCGIRFFIDLYFLRGLGDRKVFSDMLAAHGLLKFYDVCEKIVDHVVYGIEPDKLTVKTENFVLKAGVYGNVDNYVTIGQKQRGGKFRYLWSRAFLPYAQLKEFYPKLEGRKWLTPYYELKRWLQMIFGGKMKKKLAEVKRLSAYDEKKANEIMELFGELEVTD